MSEDQEYEGVAERSASGVLIGTLAATGAATYGLGHLAEGVAKLKDTFSGGASSSGDAPKQASEKD